MPVHSIHIFDRKGKTLYTRRFPKDLEQAETDQFSEQRKLVFGMIFSLRDIVTCLSPDPASTPANSKGSASNQADNDNDGALHSVQTGASTIYNYETPTGLRLALFITPSKSTTSGTTGASSQQQQQQSSLIQQQQRAKSIRMALKHIYHELWIQCVTRSPLYTPTEPNIEDTNFGQRLEAFLKAQAWYK